LKKLTLFFLIFTLSFLTVSTVFINPVKADTTYNWIQNSGFDDSGGNLIRNGDFEAGTSLYWWFQGVVPAQIYNDGGNYVVECGFNDAIYNNFSSSVLGSDITEISFDYKVVGSSGQTVRFYVYYTNDTSSYTSFATSSAGGWIHKDFALDWFYLGGEIRGIEIVQTSGSGESYQEYFDNVIVSIVGTGQTIINAVSIPWFTYPPVGTYYPKIVDDTSNTSPNSCYFQIGSHHYNPILQVLSNLDSDSVTSFTLYALDASGSGGGSLNVKIHYTDGLWSSSNPTAINGTWIQYNFTYLIVPHKIIDEISIKPTDFMGSDIYVDTVSLLSINPVTYISFSFDLSPSPLWINSYPSGYRTMEFGSFENQAYIATCTMYNESLPCGNGTFLVQSSLASYVGNITNGVFSFNIGQRSIPVNNTIELFNIGIVSNLFNTSVIIKAYWYKIDVNPDINEQSTEKTNQFVDTFPIMLIMALFIIPATYYLGVGGFIGGFSVASIICVWTGLAPSWFIAVTVLTDLVMIFFATRQNAPKPEG
jgi:hypothetical protein